MENFEKKALEEFDGVCKIIGSYIGYMNKALDSLEEQVDESPLKFWSRRTANSAIKKVRKNVDRSDRRFTALIDELGKLMPVLPEDAFIERCTDVRRMILPLFAKSRFELQNLNKVIATISFSVKRKGA